MSLLSRVAAALDRRYGWDRLPRPLGIVALIGLRTRLRDENLYDTETVAPVPPPEGGVPARWEHARSVDGTYNDLVEPAHGRGRRALRPQRAARPHFPEPEPAILEPSPRQVSRELLTRKAFIPATTLNLLAGAWLQFEVHDWFSHGQNAADAPWKVPLAEDDPWGGSTMEIPRTMRDPTSDDDPSTPPTFVTADSHWWDASQIYGSNETFARALRSGEHGKLRLDEHGLLPADLEQHVDLSGVAGNFWVGLGILHTLFMLEHNAICDALRADEPSWSDDETLRPRAARQLGADGQDPHRRVDAGDHRPPDHAARDARQLVGPRRRARHPPLRPDRRQRGAERHPGLGDEPQRRRRTR